MAPRGSHSRCIWACTLETNQTLLVDPCFSAGVEHLGPHRSEWLPRPQGPISVARLGANGGLGSGDDGVVARCTAHAGRGQTTHEAAGPSDRSGFVSDATTTDS